MEQIYTALTAIRAPIQHGEYDLHRLVRDTLSQSGIASDHEVSLAPRCRIDLLCGEIGIEIKRGKPDRARLLSQLTRYAACQRISGLIVITERHAALPEQIGGKPVRLLCLNRLWGIAL